MSKISNNEKVKIDRFKKVAQSRTERTLASLRSLSKCSNSRTYSYNKTQINKIFRAIKAELRTTEDLFSSNASKRNHFKL